jgi:hypothetical protein
MSTRSRPNYTRACIVAIAAAVVAVGCSSSQPQGAQSNDGGSIHDATSPDATKEQNQGDDAAETNGDDGAALGDDGGDVCAEAGTCVSGCHTGEFSCDGTCGALTGNVPDGTECGANGVCESGECVVCALGDACSPAANPCHNGTLSCSTAGATCVDQGTEAAPGTPCGTASAKTFCDPSGDCSCKAGVVCKLTANACHIGVTSCTGVTPGVATCVDSGSSLLNGATCGNGLACDVGVCTAIACLTTTADGGVSTCVPANPCDLGTVASCPQGEFGAPVCTDTGTPLGAGAACQDGGTCNGDGGCTP